MVPAGNIVAYSNDLVCPGCQKPLEISGFSRNIASFAGLAAGAIVWMAASAHFSHESSALGWVLPIVYSYLALSIVAPLALILLADLRLKSVDEASPLPHESPAPHLSH
jgi:hypothetical protein